MIAVAHHGNCGIGGDEGHRLMINTKKAMYKNKRISISVAYELSGSSVIKALTTWKRRPAILTSLPHLYVKAGLTLLVKAWLADKDIEALRCQKLLVEEEEAAQKEQGAFAPNGWVKKALRAE
ncbi:hypothetical protein HPP92_028450, partial [Vanilla planifolia]